MNNIKEFFINYIWQIIQNTIGLLYKYIIRKDIITRVDYSAEDYECYLTRSGGGVTLGRYIFVNQHYKDLTNVILHERGHVKQSRILGPLYLIIIGIPSLLHAWLNNYIKCCWKDGKYNYYHFYTESWANKLMGLNKEGKLEK